MMYAAQASAAEAIAGIFEPMDGGTKGGLRAATPDMRVLPQTSGVITRPEPPRVFGTGLGVFGSDLRFSVHRQLFISTFASICCCHPAPEACRHRR